MSWNPTATKLCKYQWDLIQHPAYWLEGKYGSGESEAMAGYNPYDLGEILKPKIIKVCIRVQVYKKWYPESDEDYLAPGPVDFNVQGYQWKDTFHGGGEYYFKTEIKENNEVLDIQGIYRPTVYYERNFIYRYYFNRKKYKEDVKPTIDYFGHYFYPIFFYGPKGYDKELVILYFSTFKEFDRFRKIMFKY
jgi:hypothetical protein